jgi:hypothetical protein
MSTSRHLWVRDLLGALAVPGTYNNALSLIAQMQAEGGSAKFNPLNTTRDMPGATDYNTVHVKNYRSYGQGIDASARTLRQPNMAALLEELRAANSSSGYWRALGASPWGTKPPSGVTIEAFLNDVRRHWYERCMLPIAGT